jgi:predicted TIM-barrel fold metal-dependent hydrolase
MPGLSRRGFGKMIGSGLVAAVPLAAASAKESFDMPEGACDCHVHIVGPMQRYPMSAQRGYTPPEASVADLRASRQRLGIARNVLIQPSFYGTDNRCMLDALAELGDTARGVAVVAPDIADTELVELDKRGVRGIRINLESGENRDPHAATAALDAMAGRIRHLGWHVQIYAALPVIAAVADRIATLPVDVVIDHFGLAQARDRIGQPGFAALLDLAKAGKTYVKLSAPYRISQQPAYSDAPGGIRHPPVPHHRRPGRAGSFPGMVRRRSFGAKNSGRDAGAALSVLELIRLVGLTTLRQRKRAPSPDGRGRPNSCIRIRLQRSHDGVRLASHGQTRQC